MSRPRGFTLAEVAVAIAVLVIVLGTVMALAASLLRDKRRVQEMAEMSRDGTFLTELFARELRQAGFGLRVDSATNPSEHTNAGYGDATLRPAKFYAGVIVAAASEVAIVADLPAPNGQYPTYGMLHSRPSGVDTLAWHTENNGTCMPDAVAGSCSTADTSVFFATEAGCDAVGAVGDRTCPWASRVRPAERLQIFGGDGSWVTSAATAGALTAVAGGPQQVIALQLQPSFDAAWPNAAPGDGPSGFVGVGWVTTLDRVFYRLSGNTITRQQCTGDPDPGHVRWPRATAGASPADPILTPGGGATLTPAAHLCTVPEVIARNVQSFTLRYFDGANAPVNGGALPLAPAADKAAVSRIDYTVRFTATVNGRTLEHTVSGSVRLQNTTS